MAPHPTGTYTDVIQNIRESGVEHRVLLSCASTELYPVGFAMGNLVWPSDVPAPFRRVVEEWEGILEIVSAANSSEHEGVQADEFARERLSRGLIARSPMRRRPRVHGEAAAQAAALDHWSGDEGNTRESGTWVNGRWVESTHDSEEHS